MTEPHLLMSQEEDQIEMGAEAHLSFLKHLKEIRQQAEKEFSCENIFSKTEVQDVMIGVKLIYFLSFCYINNEMNNFDFLLYICI